MAPAEICNPSIPIPDTIWQSFKSAVSKTPQDVAYTVYYEPADHLRELRCPKYAPSGSYLNWTFAELEYATVSLAAGMLTRGVKRGSIMVTFLPNGIARELCLWVSVALQLTLLPCDPALLEAGREEQFKEYIDTVSPGVVIVSGDQAATTWEERSLGTGALQLILQPTTRPDWTRFTALPLPKGDYDAELELIDQQDLEIENDRERIIAILFTSGTSSGKPKGCAIRSRQILTGAHGDSVFDKPVQSLLVPYPNYRAAANWMTYHCILQNTRLVFPSVAVDIAAMLDVIEICQVEGAIIMPFMVHLFSKDAKFIAGKRDLSSFKRVMLGGDVITVGVIEQARAVFPNAVVRGSSSISECIAALTSKKYREGLQPTFGTIVSAGYPAQATYARFCDENRKKNVQPELFYEDQKGNWMLTGDRAFMDENGFIFITGRLKDIIKKRGRTISPAIISSRLNKQPGVLATVFGVPHEIDGESVVAVIDSADPSNTPERIKQIVQESLGNDYALDEVYSLGDLGLRSFPIGPTGKILRQCWNLNSGKGQVRRQLSSDS
ncbi:4-coumarate--CoA ligase-like 5 [Cercospora beticola]|uniref:4-coumarate--CoA ligase-like 5 n=2 Tax=Cercospora beticola TaxID=122368 RepID=A0A2G5HYQ0_CERBT|nr:4-coumarate--CoA ligase-like 5 [Cercospora beticola]PIA97621.1 4-coumarate--CoA ligase-like 5 [Cercospora beticola]